MRRYRYEGVHFYINGDDAEYQCISVNIRKGLEKSLGSCYNNICMIMSTGGLRGEPYMSERTDDNYISLENAAEYLNIKPVTLRKWIKQKEDLPAHQIGRLWKFKRSELDEWVNSGKSAI